MNPRDRAVDTAKGRSLSVTACEQMLWEAGFTHERNALPQRAPTMALVN